MQRKLYTQPGKKNWPAVLATVILLIGLNGLIIVKVEPKNILIEFVELLLFGSLWVLIVAWVSGKAKWGFVITGAMLYLLVMNRAGWLGWPSLGAGLIIFGLISLMN